MVWLRNKIFFLGGGGGGYALLTKGLQSLSKHLHAADNLHRQYFQKHLNVFLFEAKQKYTQ